MNEGLNIETDLAALMQVSARRAQGIARGVIRLFATYDAPGLHEVPLANGRRADIMALNAQGEVVIAEIKSSVADFRSDNKWPEYQPFCDRFYFAVASDFPQDLIPEEVGLIVADPYGGAILRESDVHKLSAARRKAVMLRFARLAAARLAAPSLT
ncbi:MAG: MmcB family DNA repair protein [Pseudomonadota bacterium]